MGYTFKRPDPAAMERVLTRFPYSPEGAILRLAWLEGLSREEIAASDSPALPADFLRWLEETPCEPGEITSELFPNPGGGPDLEVTVLAPEESPEERIGCVMAARVPAGSEQTV